MKSCVILKAKKIPFYVLMGSGAMCSQRKFWCMVLFLFGIIRTDHIMFSLHLLIAHLFYHCSTGLDLLKGTVRNNLEAGVIEPAMSKVKIIQVTIVEKLKWF